MLTKEMIRFGQYDDAISAYKYILEQSRNLPEAKICLYDLFNIFLKSKKDTSAAIGYLEKLITNFPDDNLIAIAKSELGISEKQLQGSFAKSQKITKSNIERTIPESFELYQNFPNPFNPVTTIKYQLPEDAHVTLSIYDIPGREVVRLSEGINLAGYYESRWDGKEKSKTFVASGIYFCRITIKSVKHSNIAYVSTKKNAFT